MVERALHPRIHFGFDDGMTGVHYSRRTVTMQLAHVLDFKEKPNVVVTVSSSMPVRAAVDLLCEHQISALPVVDSDDGKIAGIVTERDFVTKCCATGTRGADCVVGDIMSRDVIIGKTTDKVIDVLGLMSTKHIHHLPLVDNEKKLIGIVSIGDVLRALYHENEVHLRRLGEYMAATYHNDVY